MKKLNNLLSLLIWLPFLLSIFSIYQLKDISNSPQTYENIVNEGNNNIADPSKIEFSHIEKAYKNKQ